MTAAPGKCLASNDHVYLADFCSTCGRPTFDLKCFLNHHFAWCLTHQRPVASGQQCSSSRDGRQCQHITWGKHHLTADVGLAAMTDYK